MVYHCVPNIRRQNWVISNPDPDWNFLFIQRIATTHRFCEDKPSRERPCLWYTPVLFLKVIKYSYVAKLIKFSHPRRLVEGLHQGSSGYEFIGWSDGKLDEERSTTWPTSFFSECLGVCVCVCVCECREVWSLYCSLESISLSSHRSSLILSEEFSARLVH